MDQEKNTSPETGSPEKKGSFDRRDILKGLITLPVLGIFLEKLIKKYWESGSPFPITLIFKKHDDLPGTLTGGRDTVAVRMAGLKAVRDIIDIAGPIVSTSTNISGQEARPTAIEDIPQDIRRKVDMTVSIAGGPKGMESTIVDVSGDSPVLIRDGALSFYSNLKSL